MPPGKPRIVTSNRTPNRTGGQVETRRLRELGEGTRLNGAVILERRRYVGEGLARLAEQQKYSADATVY